MWNAEIYVNENEYLSLSQFKWLGENDIVCRVQAGSGGYQCNVEFFITQHGLDVFVSDLKKIHKKYTGEALLQTEHEKPYIKIQGDKLGHVLIEVRMCLNDGYTHICKVTVETDQTLLYGFYNQLQRFLNNETES